MCGTSPDSHPTSRNFHAKILVADVEKKTEALTIANGLFYHAFKLPLDEQHLWLFSEEALKPCPCCQAPCVVVRGPLSGGQIITTVAICYGVSNFGDKRQDYANDIAL